MNGSLNESYYVQILGICTVMVVRYTPPYINNLQMEQVQQYKYLGFIVNVSNSTEEEIKERIALGTKVNYTNLKFFKSRLVTKQSKLKLYRTVIRPIVTMPQKHGY